jgi:hypothetical protein
MKESGYYIDFVRINSKQKLQELKKALNVPGIKIKKPYPVAMRWGYKSRLDLIAPTKKDLAIILENESRIHPYKIAYLEIAKDSFRKTLHNADMKIFHNLKTMDRRWSYEWFIYDQLEKDYEQYRKRKPDLGTLTNYIYPKKFKFVQYARLSKINQRPCIHEEFRILGAKKIRQKTGVSTIADLIIFDSQKFLERELEKLIANKTIDRIKFGRWLAGIDGRKKKLSPREIKEGQIHVAHFSQIYNISSFAKLKRILKELTKMIEKAPGARNEFQKRVLALKGNFRRFQL